MEFIAKKPSIKLFLDDEAEISFNINKFYIADLKELKEDKDYIITIKQFRNKRSMSQNAYMWVLLRELGIKLNMSRDVLYKSYIRDFGVVQYIPVKNEAVESFIDKWQKNGIGWFCEDLGESKLTGYTKLAIYFGSSSYNTKEMATVLDAIIQECINQEIETLTLDEAIKLENEND